MAEGKPAAIHAHDLPARAGTIYPPPYAAQSPARTARRFEALLNFFGLDQIMSHPSAVLPAQAGIPLAYAKAGPQLTLG